MADSISYKVTPTIELILRKGSIADHQGDAIFLLNSSSTDFPPMGGTLNSLYVKDEDSIVKPANSLSIWDIIQEYVKTGISDSQIIQKESGTEDLKYCVAEFNNPRPYNVYAVDVTKARWPNLKYLIFGNIGNENEGVLGKIYYPYSKQHISRLEDEIDTLLKGTMEKSKEMGFQDLAMPVLTGDKTHPLYFFVQLVRTLEETDPTRLPSKIVVYAYEDGHYEHGLEFLGRFKSKK